MNADGRVEQEGRLKGWRVVDGVISAVQAELDRRSLGVTPVAAVAILKGNRRVGERLPCYRLGFAEVGGSVVGIDKVGFAAAQRVMSAQVVQELEARRIVVVPGRC